jgi:signal recognition particle receptor subunit beta
MVLFNYSTRELTAKIVYYGPGLCGKTTNLQYVYESLPDNVKKGKMLSLATKTDRTLFFDFLPLELGRIRGMKTRVQLYTVPGQVFYNSTRKLVLKGADGVVFVADSQSKMLEANLESYKNLEDNLREMGLRIEEIPLVMQFNKRDLPHLSSIEEMNAQINRHNAPFYEAVATTGIGVEDTLKAITKLVLNNLAVKYKLDGTTVQEGAAPAEAAPEPAPRPAPPGPRPVAPPVPRPAVTVRPARPAPPLPEEDLALEALEVEEPTFEPAPARPPGPSRPAPTPARAASREPDDVIDLVDEIDLPDLEEKADDSVDLGEDLLQELETEPVPVAARTARRTPEAPRSAAPPSSPLRAVSARVGSEEPIDLDEPIDLGENWEQSALADADSAVDIGPISPGQERTIDLPVTATVDGRPVRLSLRVTVRLSR